MPPVRIRHNIRAYEELRSSPGVRKELESIAGRIAARCNAEIGEDGYRTSSQQGGGRAPRWRTTVITATARAIRHNAAHNTLVRNFRA